MALNINNTSALLFCFASCPKKYQTKTKQQRNIQNKIYNNNKDNFDGHTQTLSVKRY